MKNPLAQKHLRSVKKGDRIFYYHTGDEKAVVGIAKALGDAYPDPDDPSRQGRGRRRRAGEEAGAAGDARRRSRPTRAFKDFPLVRISRLSVMPVTDAEWTADREDGRRVSAAR